MNRIELKNWIKRVGHLDTFRGRKYLQVRKIEATNFGMWDTALSWLWGANDWIITFSLHDKKPAHVFVEKIEHGDGSLTVREGDVSYFVPAGREVPALKVNWIKGPLQSSRPLPANVQLLTEYVNDHFRQSQKSKLTKKPR